MLKLEGGLSENVDAYGMGQNMGAKFIIRLCCIQLFTTDDVTKKIYNTMMKDTVLKELVFKTKNES